MTSISYEESFQLPARALKKLSFCRTDHAAIQQWVQHLPTADSEKSAKQLYLATKELLVLECSAAKRMELLAVLHPAIHSALTRLESSYLNKPVFLPLPAKNIALLCHALQNNLANAYILSACQASEQMGRFFKKPSQQMAHAIHLALQEYSRILLRCFQLYQPEPERLWKHIHRLYQLACKYKLEHIALKTADAHGIDTLEQHYIYLLLLGCVRPYQLRQEDIAKIAIPAIAWAKLVQLDARTSQQEELLVVDIQSDLPPVYSKYYQGKISDNGFCFNTQALIEALRKDNAVAHYKKQGLSKDLLNHLILAWGVFSYRTFMRLESNQHLSLAVGLTAAHYFLSGEKSFKHFVFAEQQDKQGAQAANFSAKRRQDEKLDMWDISLFGSDQRSQAQVTMESIDYHIRTEGSSMMTFTGSDKEKYQNFQVDIVNTSPAGYCLSWDKNTPTAIRAGELVALKEQAHHQWNIGVIRWARQSKEHFLHIGIELLSPKAEPIAVRHTNIAQQSRSDYLRAIILPEIKATATPRSVLLPALSFTTGQCVLFAHNGQEQTVQLTKQLSSTGSYYQYAFELVKPLAQTQASGNMFSIKNNDISDNA